MIIYVCVQSVGVGVYVGRSTLHKAISNESDRKKKR